MLDQDLFCSDEPTDSSSPLMDINLSYPIQILFFNYSDHKENISLV